MFSGEVDAVESSGGVGSLEGMGGVSESEDSRWVSMRSCRRVKDLKRNSVCFFLWYVGLLWSDGSVMKLKSPRIVRMGSVSWSTSESILSRKVLRTSFDCLSQLEE